MNVRTIGVRLRAPLVAMATAALLAGCGTGEPSAAPVADGLIATPVGEETRAEATPPEGERPRLVGAGVEASSALGTALFTELAREGEGNLSISPFSLTQALGMSYAGASGRTAEQMAEVLAVSELEPEVAHRAFGALDRSLDREIPGGKGYSLEVANELWVEATYGVEPGFLETLAGDYGSGVRGADFIGDPEGSRELINELVAEQTEGRIEELMPEDSIDDELTRLVITNAIHFEALWATPFKPAGERAFHLLDGGTRPVRTMSARWMMAVAEGDGHTAVEIPYRDRALEGKPGRFAMLLVVPDRGEYERVEAELERGLIETAVAELAELGHEHVKLELPPFEIHSTTELRSPLEALGMVDAFDDDRADFTAINPGATDEGLHIDDVHHQAFVRVDELGTEATAATGVEFQAVGGPEELTVDRPFIFAIRDRETDAILFLGRLLEPDEQPPPAVEAAE